MDPEEYFNQQSTFSQAPTEQQPLEQEPLLVMVVSHHLLLHLIVLLSSHIFLRARVQCEERLGLFHLKKICAGYFRNAKLDRATLASSLRHLHTQSRRIW